MKNSMVRLLAGASLLGLVPAASLHAQEQAARAPAAAVPADEIIVTARRKAETLLDVPQTVVALTSDQLRNNNLQDIAELTKVVAGVQIVGSNISMRGVTYDFNSAASQTVATYINDAPIQPSGFLFSNFDVGQIEVLRGPQGTVRGIAAPSGAITYTTRRPDPTGWGAYADLTFTSRDGIYAQGAINIPVVRDILAVRVAGVVNDTKGDFVTSLNNPTKPSTRREAIRGTILFQPTDNFTAVLEGQKIRTRTTAYTQVFGTGSPGGGAAGTPAGYNGPAVSPDDLRSVQDQPNVSSNHDAHAILNLDWTVLDHRISYVGSYQKNFSRQYLIDADTGNSLPGEIVPGPKYIGAPIGKQITHELRIQSVERLAGMFDYVVGAYHSSYRLPLKTGLGPAAYLPGAFGSPAALPVLGAPNGRYQIDTILDLLIRDKETSFFGNVTGHFLDDKLEVSGGLRRIVVKNHRATEIESTAGFIAQAIPPAFCPLAGGQLGATYPGICDIPVPGGVAVSTVRDTRSKPWIWDATASYHFDPDLMVYVHAGSSFRPGISLLGINNSRSDPLLDSFTFLNPERSKSYEVGLKWSLLDRRVLFAIDYYHQTYDGLIYSVRNVPYLTYAGNTPSVSNAGTMSANAPATVDGIDVSVNARVTPRWDFSVNFSWANGRLKNALVPCNDGNFDGVADAINPTPQGFVNAGTFVGTCRTNAGSSTAPKWNIRAQSEYRAPIARQVEGFVRGLLQYQPRNPNNSLIYTVPAFTLMDVFLGVRDPDGRWEASVFGKNITNNRTVLSRSDGQYITPGNVTSYFGQTGYYSVTVQRPREFGLNLKYNFGTR